ncbi:MAG: hypothetical protein K6G80_11465 [Treponema sp.]|nr:hypothetical protein [Treponema sp.]
MTRRLNRNETSRNARVVSQISKLCVCVFCVVCGSLSVIVAQGATEEKIELPDVTTVVTGDTLTAGKEAIPDYSVVLPSADSGVIELPSLEKPEPQAAAPSTVYSGSVSAEKNVYAEGQIGGGFPFLFLGDFAIYRATGDAPFSLTFNHRSAEDFASNKAKDGFFARTTAVGAVQSLHTDHTKNTFSASYDTADYGLQSLSAPYFDMVNHTISLTEDSTFLLPHGWFINLGGGAHWYNRFGGTSTESSKTSASEALDDVAAHTISLDVQPHFGFGWKNDLFAAGFASSYQLQVNLGDGSNLYTYDGSTYRNATHRGEFDLNAAITTRHVVIRGKTGIVVGSALGKPALVAPFTVGTDLFIPFDESSNRDVTLSLEGGLESRQQTLRELEKLYRYSYLNVLPSETTDWYGKTALSVPLFESLTFDAAAELRKTAFENGVWTVSYTEDYDAASGLYCFSQENRTDLATKTGISFDWKSIAWTAVWEAHWMDVPALCEKHALCLSAVYQSSADRCTVSVGWKQALGKDSDKAPDVGAGLAVRVSGALRLALEVNDIVKLCANTTRTYAHSAYKKESGSAALLVKFQF